MQGVGTESDYYAILGVDRDAAPESIRKTYRRLMQTNRIHPDLGGNSRAAAAINKAYTVLSNAGLRQEYDARLLVLERVAAGLDIETAPVVSDPDNACLFCQAEHNYSPHADLGDKGCERCEARCSLHRPNEWSTSASGPSSASAGRST